MFSSQKCGVCVLGYCARALGEGSQLHIIDRVWLLQPRRMRPYRPRLRAPGGRRRRERRRPEKHTLR